MGRKRAALIGLGMAVTPHARSLLDLAERVEVAYAFSRSEARRAAFAARFPFPVTDRLDAIAADPALDLVLILTPPDSHLELVRRFAAAGKHILLEKPLATSTDRAEALVNTAKAAGVRLGVVFQYRFRAASQALIQAIDAGRLGQLAAVSVVCPWWRPQSYYDQPGRGTLERDGGGVLMTQAIHTLDLMLCLAGPVAEVAGLAGTTALHRMATEDFVGAGLRFVNGAIGGLIATTAHYPGGAERLELTGTLASAVLTAGGLDLRHLDGRAEQIGASHGPGGGGADPMDFPHDAHRALLADFLDALDAGRSPSVSGEQALQVHRLIDALLQAAGERRAVVL
jgi:predicted dehydrogenase